MEDMAHMVVVKIHTAENLLKVIEITIKIGNREKIHPAQVMIITISKERLISIKQKKNMMMTKKNNYQITLKVKIKKMIRQIKIKKSQKKRFKRQF